MKLKTSNSEVRLSLNKITKKLINNQNDRYFDREISWLSFNERVLLQAYDKTIPYSERLRFVTISSEYLDSINFKIKKNKLICKIKPEAKALMDMENERRLKNFANACNLNCDII